MARCLAVVILASLTAAALAGEDFCTFPVEPTERLCPPSTEALGDLDPTNNCILYSVMGNNKSCSTVCSEKSAKCVNAVDDLRTKKPCQYNKDEPVDCETANYYDLHCICEVPKEVETECDYLHPLKGKNEVECTEGTFTTELKEGGKNCVALARLHKRSTCSDFCESKGATCVDAVDNTVIGKGCEGNYDMVEAVDCDSKGFQDLHCICTKDEPTTTTTTTTPGCDALLPFVNPGEKFCTEGDVVAEREENGANCVIYAVLAKRSSCNDFCEARNTVCVSAIDNLEIGKGCEYDLEEEVTCAHRHFFDIHCVCRKPTHEGCSSVALCDDVCNVTYAEDRHKARCLQHCSSNAEKFLDFAKDAHNLIMHECSEEEGAALLQRKVDGGGAARAAHRPDGHHRVHPRHHPHHHPHHAPPCAYKEYCKGLCGAIGYLAGCEEKCLASAHAVSFLLKKFYDTCVDPLEDDQ